MQPPSVALYLAIVGAIDTLKIPTYTPTQDVPKKLPAVRIALINSDPTNAYKNARQYSYPFQIDVVTGKDDLIQGLTIAYKIQDILRKLVVNGYHAELVNDPSVSSLVDTSTNQPLNRQLIQVTYNIIQDTAF